MRNRASASDLVQSTGRCRYSRTDRVHHQPNRTVPTGVIVSIVDSIISGLSRLQYMEDSPPNLIISMPDKPVLFLKSLPHTHLIPGLLE
jgi:hypothetical protein